MRFPLTIMLGLGLVPLTLPAVTPKLTLDAPEPSLSGLVNSPEAFNDADGDGQRDLAVGTSSFGTGQVLFFNVLTRSRFASLTPPPEMVTGDIFFRLHPLPDLEGDWEPNFSVSLYSRTLMKQYVYNGLEPALAAGEVWVMR